MPEISFVLMFTSVTLLFVSMYTGEVYCLMFATPPHIKKTSPRIWTNHRNDQNEFQNRGNPRFRGTISCLNFAETFAATTPDLVSTVYKVKDPNFKLR